MEDKTSSVSSAIIDVMYVAVLAAFASLFIGSILGVDETHQRLITMVCVVLAIIIEAVNISQMINLRINSLPPTDKKQTIGRGL